MANNAVAYGFLGIQDLFSQRVQAAGPQRIYTAITESLAEYTRITNNIMGSWIETTEIAQEQYELPAGGTLQPLDEWGNPLPVQPSGNYQVGYPIQGGGTAFGTNRITRAMLTVDEANRLTVNAMMQDKDWILRHALAALLTNTAWTYNDKLGPGGYKGLGNISIQPLANNDSVTYVRVGTGLAATDNHYVAQAANISDAANPFMNIRNLLIEHPSNSGPFVCYLASNLLTQVQALTEFIENPRDNVIYSANANQLDLAGVDMATILGPGKEILGKTKSSNIWLVDTPILPSGYAVTIALGSAPVLKMREYPAPELKGFFGEMHSDDGNQLLSRFIRYAGFGVANRVAAVVLQVGNASYQIPSAYTAPLAV